MNKAGKITSVNPPLAIPGSEVLVECEGLELENFDEFRCLFDDKEAWLVAASNKRILAIVPEDFDSTDVHVRLENAGDTSEPFQITVGKKLADDMHIVANPAVDPNDDSIILTRSGTRGQHLPVTLFRLGKDGFLDEMPADVMNPTGVAFDPAGNLFVTNRADGEVYRVNHETEVIPVASNLGIATGIAFDKNGDMFIGDRGGTVYRVNSIGNSEIFAALEPSVAAYHMAFGPDGRLYVTTPGLASFDGIYAIDPDGYDQIFYRGLGRPQGLAFDREGNLYVAGCLRGRRGITRISPDGETAETFVAGMNIVGLCFTRQGEMIVATGEAVYTLPVDIYGTLLD